ncbi:formylglycine-generating enzyme family protein [Tautonia rosea]|uniref:formylglycine-generating enzyme family protein n=1 Tax=Tautonia rosea TaxID=2728037 RepID=UPI0021BCE144|nr:formylglycine-generating enzyme family protein [Tautonia rosea]
MRDWKRGPRPRPPFPIGPDVRITGPRGPLIRPPDIRIPPRLIRPLTINLPGLPAGARPLRLVRIPAGTFPMGAVERGSSPDEAPVHSVTISRPFYLGQTLLTQAQWGAVMGSLPTPIPWTLTGGVSSIGLGDDVPIDSISWDDVAGPGGFLDTLNSLTGRNFRLPTEAEWEYACRAGTQTRFSFGDSLDAPDHECFDGPAGTQPGQRTDYVWYCANQGWSGDPDYGGKPVAAKRPNPFGLYDVHGNFFEYCSDWYDDDFYSRPEAILPNPENQASGSGCRVIRGGSWHYSIHYARSALRYHQDHDTPDWAISVRVALSIGA